MGQASSPSSRLRSAFSQLVRAVHALQVNYADNSDNEEALQQLTGYNASTRQPITPNSAFNALRAARDEYGADLVAFVRRYREPEQTGCGIAWLLGMNQSGIQAARDAEFGYAVVSDGEDRDESDGQSYFCSPFALAHELGHITGGHIISLYDGYGKAAKISLLSTLVGIAAALAGGGEAAMGAMALGQQVAMSNFLSFNRAQESSADAAGALAAMTDDQIAAMEQAYAADRAALANQFAALRDAAPPAIDELPDALRSLWMSEDGSLLLRIYPESGDGATSPLSPQRLNPFAESVLAAAPSATGPAIQIYESTRLIGRAYLLAGVYATAVILILLFLDFRNLGDALSALAPVVIAGALLVATMRLAGISLNFANMIVLPLIVGLGVSAGVHATHRWRLQPLDTPAGLAGGSGRAVTLTILTTVIGFACMMIAEHRGIRSLGMVMSLGLSLVWVATVFFLPAILRIRTRETTPPLESIRENDQ